MTFEPDTVLTSTRPGSSHYACAGKQWFDQSAIELKRLANRSDGSGIKKGNLSVLPRRDAQSMIMRINPLTTFTLIFKTILLMSFRAPNVDAADRTPKG